MNIANPAGTVKRRTLALPFFEREQLFYLIALVAKNPPSCLGRVEFCRCFDLEWPSVLIAVGVQYDSRVFYLVVEHDYGLRCWELDEHDCKAVDSPDARELERWLVAVAETLNFEGVNPVFD